MTNTRGVAIFYSEKYVLRTLGDVMQEWHWHSKCSRCTRTNGVGRWIPFSMNSDCSICFINVPQFAWLPSLTHHFYWGLCGGIVSGSLLVLCILLLWIFYVYFEYLFVVKIQTCFLLYTLPPPSLFWLTGIDTVSPCGSVYHLLWKSGHMRCMYVLNRITANIRINRVC